MSNKTQNIAISDYTTGTLHLFFNVDISVYEDIEDWVVERTSKSPKTNHYEWFCFEALKTVINKCSR